MRKIDLVAVNLEDVWKIEVSDEMLSNDVNLTPRRRWMRAGNTDGFFYNHWFWGNKWLTKKEVEEISQRLFFKSGIEKPFVRPRITVYKSRADYDGDTFYFSTYEEAKKEFDRIVKICPQLTPIYGNNK